MATDAAKRSWWSAAATVAVIRRRAGRGGTQVRLLVVLDFLELGIDDVVLGCAA